LLCRVLPRHFLRTFHLQRLASWDPVGRCVTGGTVGVGVSVRATCASKPPYHDEVETPAIIIKCVRSIKISFKDYFIIHKSSMTTINPLNPELNPIRYLLALVGVHHFLHVSRIRVKSLTLRVLMPYIYGAPILDVSRSHTTTQHSR